MAIIRTEHFGMARKIIANMTSESWEHVPHGCMIYEPEIGKFLDVLKEINTNMEPSSRISLNTAMLKVVAEGLKLAPEMNSHIHFNRRFVTGRIEIMDNVDVSMPAILPGGEMMTLKIEAVEKKTLRQLNESIQDKLKKAANSNMTEAMYSVSMADSLNGLKKGKVLQALCRLGGAKLSSHPIKTLRGSAKKDYYLTPEHLRLSVNDLKQGTITVSNLGSIYRHWKGYCTLLEIVPPQVTAIGIGAVQQSPIVKDGAVAVGYKLPMCIAFDHRALDLIHVIPFVKRLDEIFKEPEQLKDWL